MVFLYYTVVGIALYLLSDWMLNRVEIYYGRRFEYRTVLFFAIILFLALITFWGVRLLFGNAV